MLIGLATQYRNLSFRGRVVSLWFRSHHSKNQDHKTHPEFASLEEEGKKMGLSIPENVGGKSARQKETFPLLVGLQVHSVQLANTGECKSFLLNFRSEIS